MIGAEPFITGGSPSGFSNGLTMNVRGVMPYPNWLNENFAQPLRAPEPPPKPEPMNVHVDWVGYRVSDVPPCDCDDEEDDLGDIPEAYPPPRDKLVAHLRKAVREMQFQPPKSLCDLDEGLELDREVIRRCGFPGRTSYIGEFSEGRMTKQRLCVHKEGQVGIHAFSPSRDIHDSFEAAERTGVFIGRVLFYVPNSGWFLMHADEYEAERWLGRRGAKHARVAICRHIVDACEEAK